MSGVQAGQYVFGINMRDYESLDDEELSEVLRKIAEVSGVESAVKAPVYSFMKPMLQVTVKDGHKGTDVERAAKQVLGQWP